MDETAHVGTGASAATGEDTAPVVEVVHSRLRSGAEAEMLALRPRMIDAVRSRCPGMLDARLVHLDDGTWLDVVTWASRDAAEQAAEAFASIPEAVAMQGLLEEILSFRHGVVAEPAAV